MEGNAGRKTDGDFVYRRCMLSLLFYRYESEFCARKMGEDFSYESLRDDEAEKMRSEMIEKQGFFIRPSELFRNLAERAEEEKDLGAKIAEIFESVRKSADGRPEAESPVLELFDRTDFEYGKTEEERTARNRLIGNLLSAIGDLKVGERGKWTLAEFADAYELLSKADEPD